MTAKKKPAHIDSKTPVATAPELRETDTQAAARPMAQAAADSPACDIPAELPGTELIRLQDALRQQDTGLPEHCQDIATVETAVPNREKAEGQDAGADLDLNLGDDPELIRDFIVEARDHLASIETNLLVLEKDPLLTDLVHSVFRSFHTIKGLTGFLQLKPLLDVAHETETMLDHAREKRIEISPRVIDIALKAADYIRDGLEALSAKPTREAMQSMSQNGELLREISSTSVLNACNITAAMERTSPELPPQAVSAEQAVVVPSKRDKESTVVRVDTAKLEYLVEMVGELVIAQSMIQFGPATEQNRSAGLSRNFAHLARVTEEIQKVALSMRMVTISLLYDKMARLVRDLGRKSCKRIELRRIGDHVELDRNIVEEITDPIVHMIRNSVDHGIEDVAERAAAGKSETAYITLEAFHQAGYIIVRMSDDGRGLRADRIRNKAIERGLISADAQLDEQSIYKLIFEPGFSTAERVTDISGRGVGMDVVRRQIEKLRGTVDVASRAGEGCCITLKLPLTLAMVDGLIIEAGTERYVLPIYSVREMFRITDQNLFTIEARAEMVLLRGALLPVVRLDRFFADAGNETGSGEIGIVVEGRTRHFCLIVDRLLGKQEVIIKSLGKCFESVTGVAGGAILGDGRVGLILDVHGFDGGDPSEA